MRARLFLGKKIKIYFRRLKEMAHGCFLDAYKSFLYNSTRATLGAATFSSRIPCSSFDPGPLEDRNFVVAFGGSGVDHLTQALAVVRVLQKAGMSLVGVVTDTDASAAMLEEMIAPLNVCCRSGLHHCCAIASLTLLNGSQVEVLILPAIKIVDDSSCSMVPVPALAASFVGMQASTCGWVQLSPFNHFHLPHLYHHSLPYRPSSSSARRTCSPSSVAPAHA